MDRVLPLAFRKRSITLPVGLVLTGAVVACQTSQATLEGLWLSQGYGYFIEIDSTTATPDDTPLTNFDVFWTAYKEHYPFFALKGLNWDSVRTAVRPRITDATTPDELFDLMSEMIAPLEDAHTFINAESLERNFWGHRPDPAVTG